MLNSILFYFLEARSCKKAGMIAKAHLETTHRPLLKLFKITLSFTKINESESILFRRKIFGA